MYISELVKKFFSALIIRSLGILSNYIFHYLIAKKFGPTGVGIFTIFYTYLQISTTIGRLGLDTFFLKKISEYSALKEFPSIKRLYFILLKYIFIYLLILSPILYYTFYLFEKINEKSHFILLVIISMFFLVILYFHSEGLRGLKKIEVSLFLLHVLPFIFGAILIYSFRQVNFKNVEFTIISYTIGLIFSAILSFILFFKEVRKLIKNNQISKVNIPSIFIIFKESVFIMFGNSLALVMGWIDILMLKILTDLNTVGIYSIVLKIIGVLNILLLAVDSFFVPKLVELFNSKTKKEKIQKFIIQANRIVFLTTLPIALLFLVFPDKILSLWGSEFVVGYKALMILTFNRVIRILFGATNISILFIKGYQHIYTIFLCISIILNIILNYILISKFSLNGAAFATFISITFLSITTAFFIRIKFKINPFLI